MLKNFILFCFYHSVWCPWLSPRNVLSDAPSLGWRHQHPTPNLVTHLALCPSSGQRANRDQKQKHLLKFKNLKHQKMKVKKFEETPLIVQLLAAGSSACFADIVTFPLDTTKVRLQIQGEGEARNKGNVPQRYRGVIRTMIKIAKEEGTLSLYNGLSAGLQRQMCFASIRIGLYETFKNFYHGLLSGDQTPKGALDILGRICAGLSAGALAVSLAQPTDVVKVRFQAQSLGEERYKSTSAAYKTIYKEEGVRGLWKGCYPNIARSSIVNVAEIVCYDLVKDFILSRGLMKDDIVCHFTSGVIAGFWTTVASSPVDVVKTRYMNSPKGMYRSAVHCSLETLRQEGFMALYKGFIPSFVRLVAWNIVLWVTYEKVKYYTVKYINEN